MPWKPLRLTALCECYVPQGWHEDREDFLAYTEQRVLRLFLWTSDDGLWDGEGCHAIATDLPISEQLMRDIVRWETDYDYIGGGLASDAAYAIWEDSPSFPRDWFNRRGEALKFRLEDELGAGWTVMHQPVQQSYPRRNA